MINYVADSIGFRTSLYLAITLVLLSPFGCSRRKYRLAADRQAYDLVAEKSNDPRWAIQPWSVYSDPRSRYYDPYDPDKPPMPPDDPASHQYMVNVAGMKGWKHWYDNGCRNNLENPSWRQALVEYAEFNQNDEVVLDLDAALELSIIHAPTYQQQLETIYLSALDVSTERFRFEIQFFGGNVTDYLHTGRYRGIDPIGLDPLVAANLSDSNRLRTNTDFRLEKQFATAGELLVGFANSFVWQFSGTNSNVATSLINFTFIQPLLRDAGRVIALEQLTIVERNLLANLRAFQQYRQGYYTNVAIGNLGVRGPQRRGGFLGGTGLTGFSGTGSGGLGGVGAATGFGFGFGGAGGAGGAGATGAGLAGGGAGTVGGFIGLLQQLQQVRNTQDSLALQLNELSRLELYEEGGLITAIQVDQFRQNIETERANLLQAQNNFETTLDNFKRSTMGLPPDLPVALDDSLIVQFQLLDPELTTVARQLAMLRTEVGQFQFPEIPSVEQLSTAINQTGLLAEQIGTHFESVYKDYAALDERAPKRESRMTPDEVQAFRKVITDYKAELAQLESDFATLLDETVEFDQSLTENNREESYGKLIRLLGDYDALIGNLSLVQARARLESVTLEPVQMESEQALVIAETNRFDVMNSRAALVDSWRLISFNANRLSPSPKYGWMAMFRRLATTR